MLAKTIRRAHVTLETSLQRAQARYDTKVSECSKDYADTIWNSVNDYIDEIGRIYPFKPQALCDLRNQTTHQMKIVMYEKKCLQHKAIDELSENKIDWFCQPFFKGDDITLSQLLNEFDALQKDEWRTPSEHMLQYMDVESQSDAEYRLKRRRVSSS